MLMEPAGRTVQKEPLSRVKCKVPPWRRPCATSSAAPRQQATAVGSATTPLSNASVIVAPSLHSICIMLKSWRKPVSRQSQQTQQCTAISACAHTTNTPLVARLACASLPTWDGLIACVDEEIELTICKPNALSSQRFPCRR